jgi:hypothetical protein
MPIANKLSTVKRCVVAAVDLVVVGRGPDTRRIAA